MMPGDANLLMRCVLRSRCWICGMGLRIDASVQRLVMDEFANLTASIDRVQLCPSNGCDSG